MSWEYRVSQSNACRNRREKVFRGARQQTPELRRATWPITVYAGMMED
jgi:hypothetical protein